MSDPADKPASAPALARTRRVESKRPRQPRVTAELAEDNSPAVIELLAEALDFLVEYLTAPGVLERAQRLRADRAGQGGPDPAAELDRARAEVARLDAAERTALDRHARGLVTDAGLDQHLGRLATQRAAARQSLAAAERAVAGPRLAVARADGLDDAAALLRERGHELPAELRQRLVRALVSSVAIDDGQIHLRIRLDRTLLGRGFASGSSPLALDHMEGDVRFLLRRRWAEVGQARALAASVDVPPPASTTPVTLGRDGQAQNARGERLEVGTCGCGRTYWRVAGAGVRHCGRSCWYRRVA